MDELEKLVILSKERKDDIIHVPRTVLNQMSESWRASLKRQYRKKVRAKKLNEDRDFVKSQASMPPKCEPSLPKNLGTNSPVHSGEVESDPMNEIRNYYENNTFTNQREFAHDILSKITESDGKISQILALAPTQSGKTGTMIACLHESVNIERIIPWNHVFVYTPHSSKDWLVQTKSRFPPCLRQNIHHRNHTDDLMKKIKNILHKKEKNILIIIDEAHIACKYNQSLFHMYKTLGLYDRNVLYEYNIKILMFTAKPEGLKSAMENDDLPWKQHTKVVHMTVPSQYLSIDDFQKKGIIHPMRDLCGYDKEADVIRHHAYSNILEMLKHIDPKNPKYHIIRTLNGKNHLRTIHNFMALYFDDIEVPDIEIHRSAVPVDMKNKVGLISEPMVPSRYNFDVNKMLNRKPKKHYFIFIKDKLRCAKTINTSHVGVLYERKVKNPKFSTMIQGLAGRATGIQKSYPSAIYFDLKPPKSYPQNFLDFIQTTKPSFSETKEKEKEKFTNDPAQ